MASDSWAKELLADVARETRIEVDNLMRLGSNREILAEVLERRLLPLLEAGQACANEVHEVNITDGHPRNLAFAFVAEGKYVAAKSAALKEATDGER